MQLVEQVRAFVKRNLAVHEDDIVLNNDDNIFELGFVDSVFAIQLICFIEDEFKIRLSDDDLDISNFRSITQIVEFVSRKTASEDIK